MYVYGFHCSAPRTRTYTCLKGSPEIHTGKFLWAGLFHMLMSERIISTIWGKGSPGGSVGKESARIPGFDTWVRMIPWKKNCLPTPVFLPGESHGQGSLEGYSPWAGKQSVTTEAT